MEDRRLLESQNGAERRHVSTIADEFFQGFNAVAEITGPAVSIFGSARIREGHPAYEAARATARGFAERGFAVVLWDRDYWGGLIDWIHGRLLAEGTISPDDEHLLVLTDDTEEAVETVIRCYEERCAKSPAAPRKADAQ